MAIYWSVQGFKARTFELRFSTNGILISASVLSHWGILQKHSKFTNLFFSALFPCSDLNEKQIKEKRHCKPMGPPAYDFHRFLLQVIRTCQELESSGQLSPSAENNDLKVDVDGEVITCKKYLLSRISPVFRHVISTCRIENKTVVLDSEEEFKSHTFNSILDTVFRFVNRERLW